MRKRVQLLVAVTAVMWVGEGSASQTKVVISLSEQRAYLIEQGRVALVYTIASGKPGLPTPTGDSRVFNKDIDHLSGSFGSVLDHWGRVVNANATPGSRVPPGGTIGLRRYPASWKLSRQLGCMPVTFQGIPLPTCVRMPRDLAAIFYR